MIFCYNNTDDRRLHMNNNNKNIPFEKRHPVLNFIFGLTILISIIAVIFVVIYYSVIGVSHLISRLSNIASKLDAVVIVALITGGVSIISVVFTSVIAKIIDYKQNRREYLTQKREMPYGEFVDMVYKIQKNTKQDGTYTEEEMISDISKFSKQITLWGSTKVVNKWVEFREKSMNPNQGADNLFLLEEIMNEMRKDLGVKKSKKGNLLAFFVNDIKEFIKK